VAGFGGHQLGGSVADSVAGSVAGFGGHQLGGSVADSVADSVAGFGGRFRWPPAWRLFAMLRQDILKIIFPLYFKFRAGFHKT
jgi:hypothetical protein